MIHCLRVVTVVDVKTEVVQRPREEPWGKPVYRPGGVRHRGGASSVQAPVRNVGTWSLDIADGRIGVRYDRARGRTASGSNRKRQSTEARPRLGLPHSVRRAVHVPSW